MKSMLRQTTLSLALAASFAGAFAWSTDSHACAIEPYIGSVCTVAFNRGCPSGYKRADGSSLPVNQYQALYSLIGNTFGGNQTAFNLPNLNGRMPVGVGQATQISGQPPTSAVTLGQYRGAENVILTATQLPAHIHPAIFTATTGQQAVTLPAQPGSGSITATAATDIVPGNTGVDPGPNVPNYYLTGVSTSAAGPVTTTVPGTDKSTLTGTHVTVDTSTYKPAIAQQTLNITAVTGGSVAIGANTPVGAAVSTLPPQLGLYYCIATEGLYPQFD